MHSDICAGSDQRSFASYSRHRSTTVLKTENNTFAALEIDPAGNVYVGDLGVFLHIGAVIVAQIADLGRGVSPSVPVSMPISANGFGLIFFPFGFSGTIKYSNIQYIIIMS